MIDFLGRQNGKIYAEFVLANCTCKVDFNEAFEE